MPPAHSAQPALLAETLRIKQTPPVNSLKDNYRGRIVEQRTLAEAVSEGKKRVNSLVRCQEELRAEGTPSASDMLDMDTKR